MYKNTEKDQTKWSKIEGIGQFAVIITYGALPQSPTSAAPIANALTTLAEAALDSSPAVTKSGAADPGSVVDVLFNSPEVADISVARYVRTNNVCQGCTG